MVQLAVECILVIILVQWFSKLDSSQYTETIRQESGGG